MKRFSRNIFAIAALTLALVLCFTVTALADEVNDMQDTGVWLSETLGNSDRLEHDMHFATNGTLSYEITCTEEAVDIIIQPKDGSRPGMMSTTAHEGDGTLTNSKEVAAGDYVVILRNYAMNRMDATCEYRIDFKSAKETYNMSNNTIPTASGPITIGREITGHFADNDRDDIFRLKLKKAGRLTIKADEVNALDAEVLKGDGTRLGGKRIGNNESYGDTFDIDLAAGTYYLDFKYFNEFGTYKFNTSFKSAKETYTYANNSIAEVKGKKALKLSKRVRGQLAVNDEIDYFKIYIPKTGDYNLTVAMDSTYFSHGGPFDVWSLEDSNGTGVRAEGTNTDQSNPPIKTFVYRNLEKGTYYLHFEEGDAYTKVTGPYNFIMKPAPVYAYQPEAGSKKFTAKWVKGTGSGYQIQYALNKKFTKGKKSVTTTGKPDGTTVKKVIKKGIKGKKTYYVRVRSYVKYKGTKYYSDWSDTVKVKTGK